MDRCLVSRKERDRVRSWEKDKKLGLGEKELGGRDREGGREVGGGGGEKRQQNTVPVGEKSTEQLRNDGQKITPAGNLDEQDILLLENSAYESRKPYQPKSMCDKVFAWYFGWDEHPHSE